VFGPEDQFTNRFASLRQDVADAAADRRWRDKTAAGLCRDVADRSSDCRRRQDKGGATYELGGSGSADDARDHENHSRDDRTPAHAGLVPFGLAKFQALFLQFAPGPLKLTPDQVELLRSDNVVSDAAKAAA